jgi:hypothetical protein
MDTPENNLIINLILDIKKDVSELKTSQVETKEIAVKNTIVLEEHMRRTNIAEENIELIRQEMKPIKEHVQSVTAVTHFMAGLLKVLGVLATLVGAVLGFLKLR